ncbi:hypothetical protein GW17_00023959 [Ensete ventricosum]|nr:hypothetical protein GW17_00023959 [Ensete ventricosum]
MKLNRVESFNAFAARTARRRGWLATANPLCRGGRLQPRPPCKGATGHLQGAAARRGNSLQGAATRERGRLQPARNGQPPAGSPQEAAHGARGCR